MGLLYADILVNRQNQLMWAWAIHYMRLSSASHCRSGLHAVPQPRPAAYLPLWDPKMSCS